MSVYLLTMSVGLQTTSGMNRVEVQWSLKSSLNRDSSGTPRNNLKSIRCCFLQPGGSECSFWSKGRQAVGMGFNCRMLYVSKPTSKTLAIVLGFIDRGGKLQRLLDLSPAVFLAQNIDDVPRVCR